MGNLEKKKVVIVEFGNFGNKEGVPPWSLVIWKKKEAAMKFGDAFFKVLPP
jgi:hypothetical protein